VDILYTSLFSVHNMFYPDLVMSQFRPAGFLGIVSWSECQKPDIIPYSYERLGNDPLKKERIGKPVGTSVLWESGRALGFDLDVTGQIKRPAVKVAEAQVMEVFPREAKILYRIYALPPSPTRVVISSHARDTGC